jgi:hypothetical protein
VTSARLRQQRLRRRDSFADIVVVLRDFGFEVQNRNLELDPPGEHPITKFLIATTHADREDIVHLAHRDESDVDLNPGWEMVAVWDLDTGKAVAA